MFEMDQGLRLVWDQLEGRIEIRLSGSDTFCCFVLHLRHHTEMFWDRLRGFFDEHYHTVVWRTHSSLVGLTVAQKKKSWTQVNDIFSQCLRDLHAARLGAGSAHELAKRGDTKGADTRYVSAILMSHRVMQDYMDKGYKRHDNIYPRLVETLLMTGAPRSALEGFNTTVQAATTASTDNATAIDDLGSGQLVNSGCSRASTSWLREKMWCSLPETVLWDAAVAGPVAAEGMGARRSSGIVNLSVLKVILNPPCPCIPVQIGERCQCLNIHPHHMQRPPNPYHLRLWCPQLLVC